MGLLERVQVEGIERQPEEHLSDRSLQLEGE
jgi:hypothetical protein